MLLNIPFILFWTLLYVGRDELGWRGIIICVLIWLGLLLAFDYLGLPSLFFVAVQAVFDILLLMIVFGGNILNAR